mgnify:CR=1 FL=1|jgi:phage head maturation protease
MHNGHIVPILKATTSGEFSGIAWSFQTVPDTQGDVILPLALTNVATPFPVYTDHDGVSVGEVRKAEVTDEGLRVEGRIVDLAARQYAAGDGHGLSIGFIGSGQKSGPVRIFTDVEIVEVSLCKRPVNAGSRVTTLKSWRTLGTETELSIWLKAGGMPGRLAQKVAAAAWPTICKAETHDDEELAALAAQIDSITKRLRA